MNMQFCSQFHTGEDQLTPAGLIHSKNRGIALRVVALMLHSTFSKPSWDSKDPLSASPLKELCLQCTGSAEQNLQAKEPSSGFGRISKNIQAQQKKKIFDPYGPASPLNSQSLCERNIYLQVKKSSGTFAAQCLLLVQCSDDLLGASGPMTSSTKHIFLFIILICAV